MPCRSAILIDNFLPQEQFDYLSQRVSSAENYSNNEFAELRDDLWVEAYTLVFNRLKEIGLYQLHFDESIKLFGYNQFRPSNYGHGNMYGPHIDNGGYVFYIHPHWEESWGGKLQITNAVEEEYRTGIFAKPNRFIWIDPSTLHDVTTTAEHTEHSRVANIAFLGGEIYVDPVGVDFINILTSS